MSYKCTFCDWGGLTNAKVYKFELDRVFAETNGLANIIATLFHLYSGKFWYIQKERDMLIAKKLVDEHSRIK